MIAEREVEIAREELRRARELYENFLLEKENYKKGEQLWGAINNLLSGLH